jgi:NAD(P)-dependent dehydrogenase (short-subunit alcohol dehydrogenase family)
MAQAVAEVGAKGIAIIDQKSDVGIPAAQELSAQTGVDVRFYQVDIRDSVQINGAIKDIEEHYGQVDVLINSAGIAE